MRTLDIALVILVAVLFVSGFSIFILNRLPRLAISESTAPTLKFEITDIAVASNANSTNVRVTYRGETNNTDSLQILLFAYKAFEKENRSLYIFYDSQLMTIDALRRADIIIQYFNAYNVTINRVAFEPLEALSKQMSQILLLVIDPLKDNEGRRLEYALPAPLLDSDKDGYVRDDSKYGKSILYDWMKDEGLLLVTVGSLQPHKKILYGDGVYTYTRDSEAPYDTHEFLTDASGNMSLIKGGFTLGNYTPSRISDSLGLAYRETPFGFDEDVMGGYGLKFYSYGNYKLYWSNLALPVFIRVGRGGWLAMDDSDYWLSDETLAHDLFMIYQQAIWDAEWVPFGWYYDSGTVFHRYQQGKATLSGNVESESIKLNLVDGKIVLRVLGIAYSSQQQRGLVAERILEVTPSLNQSEESRIFG